MVRAWRGCGGCPTAAGGVIVGYGERWLCGEPVGLMDEYALRGAMPTLLTLDSILRVVVVVPGVVDPPGGAVVGTRIRL